ncbi:DUF342 domain-containing protein [Lutispora sp.]|nr:FapA family protein [Lutispora sp.]MEA4962737.1 FapA family protein [Lutispora sp.]
MTDNSVVLEGKNLTKLISEAEEHFNVDKDFIKVEIMEEKKSLFGSYYKIRASYEHNTELKDLERLISNIEEKLMNSNADAISADSEGEGAFIEENEKEADCEYEISVSSDAMEAHIKIYPPFGGGKEPDKESIYKALEASNIKSGILHNEVENLADHKIYNNAITIAKGKPSIPGKDASLEYHFDISKDKKMLITDDGRIDYKELSLIKNVNEGDLLVTMTPASKGISGEDVYGNEVKAIDGKTINMPKGKNVTLSEDGLKLISMINGEVKIVEGKVNVFQVYTVDGNVDNSTGNIRFLGKVIVKGNVITGFTIEADEDIEVFGVVEGAKISSKGNIVLHRGIQGMNKGELVCEGDLIAKFIENSKVYAKGNIQTDAIMHSIVYCGKKLEVKGKKGLLVGGEIRVSDEIKAKIIGSPMATVTEVEVGMNPDVRKKYDSLKAEYAKNAENYTKLCQVVDLLTKMSKKGELDDDKRTMMNKSIVLKLQTQNAMEGFKKEIQEVETYIEDISNGRIKVENIVYPGTKITIGSNSMFVRDQIQHVTFYRSAGEIKIGSFEP